MLVPPVCLFLVILKDSFLQFNSHGLASFACRCGVAPSQVASPSLHGEERGHGFCSVP